MPAQSACLQPHAHGANRHRCPSLPVLLDKTQSKWNTREANGVLTFFKCSTVAEERQQEEQGTEQVSATDNTSNLGRKKMIYVKNFFANPELVK